MRDVTRISSVFFVLSSNIYYPKSVAFSQPGFYTLSPLQPAACKQVLHRSSVAGRVVIFGPSSGVKSRPHRSTETQTN